MKTSEKIVQMLKTQGPLTAKVLAESLALTTMGVRQHLQGLEDSGDVIFEDKKAVRGRPTRFWSLTSQSNSHFTDRHPELTVQLIDSVKTVFGEQGLEQLIEHRESTSLDLYLSAMSGKKSLIEKLQVLKQLRTDEGYMASIEQEGDILWLLENHCPICAAASQCLNFCRSELQLFQRLFEESATVSREEHIIEGARRCAYKIVPI